MCISDARPSIASVEMVESESPVALDAHLRFTARAQVRPDELVTLLVPSADCRTSDVERTGMWAEPGGSRLDPMALLERPSMGPAVSRV